jgi:hypothetical protein
MIDGEEFAKLMAWYLASCATIVFVLGALAMTSETPCSLWLLPICWHWLAGHWR